MKTKYQIRRERLAKKHKVNTEKHIGIGTMGENSKYYYLLCPMGHMVDYIEIENWAGSKAEATWPTRVIECEGTI